ncbi:MAG: hypothetical protein ABL999_05690 [Pyrinomonadaceae bacterium]
MDWGTIAWKIFVCLLLAFLLGLVVGWLLSWLFSRDKVSKLESDLDACNDEKRGLRAKASSFASSADSTAAAPAPVAVDLSPQTAPDIGWGKDYESIKARLDELETLATDDEEDTDEELLAWTSETEALQAKLADLKSRAADDDARLKVAGLDASSLSLLAILKKAREDKAAGIAKLRRVGYGIGVRDDLKDIIGVGPVLEKTLNGLDVYLFSDIASWDDAKIDEVSTHLVSFQDRIRREDWVGQSKALYTRRYGEKA